MANTTTRYYYDDQRVLLETSVLSTETDTRYFVYGNYIDEVLVMHNIGGSGLDVVFSHDHLYSPVAAYIGDFSAYRSIEGTVFERYEYDAYGVVTVYPNMSDWDTASPTTRGYSNYGNPYTFTGRRLDMLDGGDLNLMYYRARTYDPETGRFMQRDPLGYVDGMNMYEYVTSGPINNFDPYGLLTWNDCCPQYIKCLEANAQRMADTLVSLKSLIRDVEVTKGISGMLYKANLAANNNNADLSIWGLLWGKGDAAPVIGAASVATLCTPKVTGLFTNSVLVKPGVKGLIALNSTQKALLKGLGTVAVYSAIADWGINRGIDLYGMYATSVVTEGLLEVEKKLPEVLDYGYAKDAEVEAYLRTLEKLYGDVINKPWSSRDSSSCKSKTLICENFTTPATEREMDNLDKFIENEKKRNMLIMQTFERLVENGQ